MSNEPRYDQILERLPEPYQRIYEAIYEAAYDNRPCPKNRELVDLCRPGSASGYAAQAISALERAGLIQVKRGLTTRIVVLPSGQSTAGTIDHPAPVRDAVTGPPVPQIRTERTSCPWCGIRSDLGCKHRVADPAPIAMIA